MVQGFVRALGFVKVSPSGISISWEGVVGELENYFTEMCSGSEAGSYLRPIDFVYHSTLGLRVIKKRDWGFVCEALARLQTRGGGGYRGTSLIRKHPSPYDPSLTLAMGLRLGPRGALYLMSKVPL